MSSRVKKMFVSAFVAAGLLTQAGVAHADELTQPGSTEKVAEATAPLPEGVENSDDVPAVKPRSAEGVTWAQADLELQIRYMSMEKVPTLIISAWPITLEHP